MLENITLFLKFHLFFKNECAYKLKTFLRAYGMSFLVTILRTVDGLLMSSMLAYRRYEKARGSCNGPE